MQGRRQRAVPAKPAAAGPEPQKCHSEACHPALRGQSGETLGWSAQDTDMAGCRWFAVELLLGEGEAECVFAFSIEDVARCVRANQRKCFPDPKFALVRKARGAGDRQ